MHLVNADVVQGEDCLYLNVFTPVNMEADLPVIVWFYGGAFIEGAGSNPIYDGFAMVNASMSLDRPVVFVSLNYRLGALGFMGSAQLAAEQLDGMTGNYGLQDQRMALEFVKANAAAFGGDANFITIMGQSAGAVSVFAHIASEQTPDGLFHRAVMLSPVDTPAKTLPQAQGVFDTIVEQTSCNDTADVR